MRPAAPENGAAEPGCQGLSGAGEGEKWFFIVTTLTGNRVHAFVDLDNKKISKWIEQNDGRTAFFVLEHKRLSRFTKLLEKTDSKIEPLSTERENNKFVLLKVAI
jgi:hypothetical protein